MDAQTFILTPTDSLIDILAAFMFLGVLIQSAYFLLKANKEKEQYRLVLAGMIGFAAILFIFQVSYQVANGTNAPLRVWDFYNYLTAIIFLGGIYRIAKAEHHALSDEHPMLKKTGIL